MSSLARSLPLPKRLRDQLVNQDEQQRFTSAFAAISSKAKLRPQPDSDEELELAVDMYVVSLSLFKGLGPKAVDILREDINQQLDTLLMDSYASTETIRKLAFAQLHEATGVFGKFVERTSAIVTELSYEVLVELLEEVLGDREALAGQLSSDVSYRQLAVMCLAVMLALEFIDDELASFTYWSRRAVEASRRVEPLLEDLLPNTTGNVSRLRAQFAWAHWDQTEIDREMNAWKDLG